MLLQGLQFISKGISLIIGDIDFHSKSLKIWNFERDLAYLMLFVLTA